MNVLTKILTFFSMKTETRMLYMEAFCYLGYARILKLLPFSKVAPSLGEHMSETSTLHLTSDKAIIKNVSHAIHLMSRYTFWESQCLIKAIAGMRMLNRRHVDSTLYLGTARDESGEMIAHAWLRSGPFYVSGSEGMEKFTVVSMFANRASDKQAEGESNGEKSGS